MSTSSRREMGFAVLGCLLGATLLLFAAGRPWVEAVAVQDPLRVDLAVKGGSLSPVVPACGLVCLAGSLGLLAARARLRRVVGLVLAITGAAAAAAAVLGANPSDGDLAERAGDAVGTASALATDVQHTPWPWLAVLAAALCAVSGLLTVARGGTWPGMSARYERPDATSAQAPVAKADSALDQWRALDRGEDPTI
ncbi:MAG: Trp biosynthesis-associated membrane protein [Sporichthyaceae bacterium]